MSASPPALTLFELRHYRMRPGRRDALLQMFEAHFRPAYEAAGALILGSFTLPDAPDDWIWLRAFEDAASREAALRGFYGGAAWARLGVACNALLERVCSARVLRARAAGALGAPPPRAQLLAAVPHARPWVLSVAGRGGAAPAQGLAGPPALELGSARGSVWLRRFDAAAPLQAWWRQRPLQGAPAARAPRTPWAGGSGTAPAMVHIRLQPTAASLLR